MPEPMVPALEPEGEIDQVTFVFAAPVTVAESCQFAPTPIGQGFVVDAAQAEFAMLTDDRLRRGRARRGRRATACRQRDNSQEWKYSTPNSESKTLQWTPAGRI